MKLCRENTKLIDENSSKKKSLAHGTWFDEFV